jgi:hypothetical protein
MYHTLVSGACATGQPRSNLSTKSGLAMYALPKAIMSARAEATAASAEAWS